MTEAPARRAVEDEMLRHLPALRAFGISMARDVTTADDLVQEAIIRAWTNLDKFQPGTNMRAWLFTILRNAYFSELRTRKREVPDPDGVHAARRSVRPEHEARLAFVDFSAAFYQLSPEHREALLLIGVSGFTYEEAADMIGVAVGTIKSRVHRARLRLHQLLGLAPGEDPVSDGANHSEFITRHHSAAA